MPIFEFDCKECDTLVEEFYRSSRCTPPECPECGKPMTRKLSAPAIIFKGTGYYTTDYGKGRMIRDAEKKESSAPTESTTPPADSGKSTPKPDSTPAPASKETKKPAGDKT